MSRFRGGMTLGALVAGSVAAVTSAPFVLVLSGSVLTLVAVYALFSSRSLREI